MIKGSKQNPKRTMKSKLNSNLLKKNNTPTVLLSVEYELAQIPSRAQHLVQKTLNINKL
jgi:hypothetical protein